MTRFLALALLAACGPKTPPASIYPSPIPELEAPELAEVTPSPDELPTVVAYLPGQPAPFTDAAGLVTRRGVVLPESRAVELYQAAELGDLWEARALEGAAYRATDRAYCDQVVTRQAQDLEAREREARWIRWAAPVALTAGVILGVGAADLGSQVGDR